MSENDLILSIQIEAPHASECAPDTAADEISISISIESALTNNQSEDLENQTKWKNKQGEKTSKVENQARWKTKQGKNSKRIKNR